MVKQDPYEATAADRAGSVETLTCSPPGMTERSLPVQRPRDAYKQTGVADLIQGQANLATCVGTSA
jgi:hypothetical protein